MRADCRADVLLDAAWYRHSKPSGKRTLRLVGLLPVGDELARKRTDHSPLATATRPYTPALTCGLVRRTKWHALRADLIKFSAVRNSGIGQLAGGADGGDEFVGGAEGEAGDGAVYVADDAVFVEDEHAAAGEAQRAEGAVGFGDGLVGIGE